MLTIYVQDSKSQSSSSHSDVRSKKIALPSYRESSLNGCNCIKLQRLHPVAVCLKVHLSFRALTRVKSGFIDKSLQLIFHLCSLLFFIVIDASSQEHPFLHFLNANVLMPISAAQFSSWVRRCLQILYILKLSHSGRLNISTSLLIHKLCSEWLNKHLCFLKPFQIYMY